jgi:hypothetical protein
MKKRVLTLATCAYILVCGLAGANAGPRWVTVVTRVTA